ncbi:MAG: hypothetical protein KJO79_09610 [Verrucomicrobiae bacterium]|nr:hypothetical protein [Verrucomicrobiae bacterium]NNJ87427.1 hypothetical protein [Akkermansiaceae bacterium]
METDIPDADDSGFLASNAEFFAQRFAPLHDVFDSSGPINIVSEEADMTVVVGIKAPTDDGAVDVDCVLLEPDQESLRDCIDTLFSED